MQIQTSLRFHLIPVRRVTTNAREDLGKGDPCLSFVGLQTGAAAMEINVGTSQKAKL